MISIINISQFNEIVKGIKAMKADLVYVAGNTLYGTDNNCMTLKTYVLDTFIPVEPFTIVTKTLSSEFYNRIIDVNISIDTDINKIYCTANKSSVDEFPEMINNSFNDRIKNIVNNLTRDICNPMTRIIDFGEITNDEYLQRFKSIKSAEGADLYTPNGNSTYGMYLYTGAIPMTKSDKISLKVYDLGNTFIAEYIIYKKKINPVSLCFRFVKLENSMYRA